MGKLKASLQKCLISKQKNQKKPDLAEKSLKKLSTSITIHNYSDGCKSLYPVRERSKILVVGDGNFSYSRSLIQIFGDESLNLVATCYDSEQELYSKYAEAAENVAFLRAKENCSVFFEVDAMALLKEKRLKNLSFHRIIFNFPHVGKGIKDKHRNILENQKLIQAFFFNCQNFLIPKSANNNITYGTNSIKRLNLNDLEAFESSLPKGKESDSELEAEIHLTLKTGDPYDLWQVKELAKTSGLRCKETYDFLFEKYPAYRHRRTIGDTIESECTEDEHLDQIIDGKHCKTFVFCQ
jgi:25S rRNA (uracil2634-N3)-methyltransferase